MKAALKLLGLSLIVTMGCSSPKTAKVDFIEDNIVNNVAQQTIQTDLIESSGQILNPRTLDKEGNIEYIPIDDWTSGFYPGNISGTLTS